MEGGKHMAITKGEAKISPHEGMPFQNPKYPGFKYPTLRVVRWIFKIVGWIVLMFGLISVASLYKDQELAAIGTFLVSLVTFLIMLAISEAIKVLVDIEENTRMTSFYAERIAKK